MNFIDTSIRRQKNSLSCDSISIQYGPYLETSLDGVMEYSRNLGPESYCDHVHFHEHTREKQATFISDWLKAYKDKKG